MTIPKASLTDRGNDAAIGRTGGMGDGEDGTGMEVSGEQEGGFRNHEVRRRAAAGGVVVGLFSPGPEVLTVVTN